ncbi:S8 family peptidase [Shimazuella sp. AN120528]|uniref:S8 family peptidase n=1 Tax=Shimazuella soli TaxID=1892854 RepID=UPI001F0D14D0|nr:S8 family peptidase [Shimazuella soli]MCH5583616.1 S8 family peptidase [Shimazuella soli]
MEPENGNPQNIRNRRIFYLKEGADFVRCSRELKKQGITPIEYLPHLGMVIGESVNPRLKVDNHPYVEHAEQDIRVNITEPSYHGSTYAVKPTFPWGIERIGAPMVWTKVKGRGIRIAVIDTGIDPSHPAIYRNYKGGINILARSFPPMDYNGHGTHVAGIIAGRSRNTGLVGVAPWASLYAVKAFNKNGSANLSDLLSAINWCIEKRMHIINMSFGMEMVSESLKKAIMIAHRKKIVMVAATGNQGLKNSIDFPARFPETIAVTSIGMNNRISPFGNRGKGVDIAAPGEKIPSAWLGQTTKEMSGTSMAVPHVSGTIALMLQLNPNLNPEQIRYLLLYTGRKMDREFIRTVNTSQAIRYLLRSKK